MLCHVWEIVLASLRHQAISQSGTIYKEAQLIFLASRVELGKFFFRIYHAQFSRQGDIDHAWLNHVRMGLVAQEGFHVISQVCCLQLAVSRRDGQHFVSEGFHRSRFMHLNMPSLHTNNSFASQEEGVDDCGVGLCATNQEKHISLFITNRLAYLFLGRFAVWVESISRCLVIIRLAEIL